MSEPRIAVTVDVVLLVRGSGGPEVLLVQRAHPPFQGGWALPGGFLEVGEDLPEAACRELVEETGVEISADDQLQQIGAYGKPGRDPRGQTVTVAYLAVSDRRPRLSAGSDAASARFWPVPELEELLRRGELTLAFDHDQIIRDALERASDQL